MHSITTLPDSMRSSANLCLEPRTLCKAYANPWTPFIDTSRLICKGKVLFRLSIQIPLPGRCSRVRLNSTLFLYSGDIVHCKLVSACGDRCSPIRCAIGRSSRTGSRLVKVIVHFSIQLISSLRLWTASVATTTSATSGLSPTICSAISC